MQPFGTPGIVYIQKMQRKKFNDNSNKVYLVGYEEPCDNYRVYDPVDSKVIVARDVRFFLAPTFEKSQRLAPQSVELIFDQDDTVSETALDQSASADSDVSSDTVLNDTMINKLKKLLTVNQMLLSVMKWYHSL